MRARQARAEWLKVQTRLAGVRGLCYPRERRKPVLYRLSSMFLQQLLVRAAVGCKIEQAQRWRGFY